MKRDVILHGDCVEILRQIPSNSIDLIFADPPYFMQTDGELLRVSGERFNGVSDEWDKFESFEAYDRFCESWLAECKRILKNSGSIWVIGSFQNIFRLGYIMQNLGFWVLNDIIWAKTNPVPNFKGTRFCNAHESLIWCAKNKKSKYTFNYKTMKFLNNTKQEKSVWNLALCTGKERLKVANGKKLHSTQKPESLLEKIILSSSKENDLVLDPFFGTGTTGAVAKRLGRHFLGIERDKNYIKAAKLRIEKVRTISDEITKGALEIKPPKISLERLKKVGLLREGERLYDKHKNIVCVLDSNNKVSDKDETLSIHKMAAKKLNKKNHNGWNFFYVLRDGKLVSINSLRYEKIL